VGSVTFLTLRQIRVVARLALSREEAVSRDASGKMLKRELHKELAGS